MAEHTEQKAEQKKFDHAAHATRTVDEGNIPTPPSTLYFTYQRPDGDEYIGPATSAETLLRQGFTITGEQTIENFTAWVEEQSAKTQAKSTADASKASATTAKTA